ncbi:MAG: transcription-repair coupling factor [Desulfosalsimonadaceae bacterium]
MDMQRTPVTDILRPFTDDIAAGRQLICTAGAGTGRIFLAAETARRLKRPLALVLPTYKMCEQAAADLQFFVDDAETEISVFPPYNILPFKQIAYHNETAARRIHLLYRLASNTARNLIIVLPVETLLQRLVPKSTLNGYAELVMANEELNRDNFIAHLHAGGFVHTGLVEEPGEYSVRGGIIDVFSPMYAEPIRIELFGDTAESIRFFSPATQRQTTSTDEAVILPAKEAVVTKQGVSEVLGRARRHGGKFGLSDEKVERFITRIREEGVFSGLESLLPLLYSELDTLFDYAPADMIWVQNEAVEIEKKAEQAENRAVRNYMQASSENRLCVDPEHLYEKWWDVSARLSEKSSLVIRSLPVSGSVSNASHLHLETRDNSDVANRLADPEIRENYLAPLAEWVDEHSRAGFLTLLVCSTNAQAMRLRELLCPYGISPEIADAASPLQLRPGRAWICQGQLSRGFVWAEASLAIITETEIFGSRKPPRARKKPKAKVQTQLLDFGELNTDDLVVHVEHGIGKYRGIEKLSIEGVTSDFLKLYYKGGDKLYLPVDRMNMVQKYMGVEGIEPDLDKLGGKSWQRSREKAKESAEKIANELLELYAARKNSGGHAFSPPDSYYKDFEAGFPFEETADQLKAIDDVITDMEQERPMDRLICGDVGYGKTEVALRAVFKTVNDGKQAAVLVPTTLLAEQHYVTFSERFARYPVYVESLSRFRSRRQQQMILERLKKGETDVVIGTHRLLQKDVAFKDLGLIVIDEEQRFGVKHKESLKQLRTIVDVLSMTATPIPRTLHMSLMGVRDISVIQTPPELRRPIMSYISEFDPMIITEAISKELERGGQIFFVHNNINTIWNMAKYLQDQVPEVRLAVAHGRLEEEELERVMYQFMNREIDMLVCTTIVESGLDIPNANTMIINRAERFGLAQIYQLRGRIGRSNEQAYAYLFVPKEAALTRDARKRLKVLMEHTDLGAGFQIAMNDLKIRGGGAALGVEQSGHIAAVGYDMFLQLLEDAVSRSKGETVVEKLEPEIHVPMSVYIPEAYITESDQRFSVYRRLSRMNELKEIADIKGELKDRYGPPPEPARNLLIKIMLRIIAIKAGVKRLDLKEGQMVLSFSELHQKNPMGVLDLIDKEPERYLFTPENTLKIQMQANGPVRLMAEAKNTLMEIATHVNN